MYTEPSKSGQLFGLLARVATTTRSQDKICASQTIIAAIPTRAAF